MEHFMEYEMAMISVKIEDDMPCCGSSRAFLGSTVASQPWIHWDGSYMLEQIISLLETYV